MGTQIGPTLFLSLLATQRCAALESTGLESHSHFSLWGMTFLQAMKLACFQRMKRNKVRTYQVCFRKLVFHEIFQLFLKRMKETESKRTLDSWPALPRLQQGSQQRPAGVGSSAQEESPVRLWRQRIGLVTATKPPSTRSAWHPGL